MNFLYNLLLDSAERPDWVVNSFPIIKLVLMIIIALLSVFMIVAVLLQKGNTNGITGVTGEADTFYNRNKGRSLEGKIKLLTIIVSVVIFVLCLVYLILNTIYSGGLA